jgi:predicted XRE-type DNA-binding protein
MVDSYYSSLFEARIESMKSRRFADVWDAIEDNSTQPRLDDLLHGKINKFSLETLLTLATRPRLKAKIDVRSAA